MAIDGVLYIGGYSGPTVLVRYPCEKTNSTFEIPSTVEFVAPHAFKGNKHLKSIIFPSNFSTEYGKGYLEISTSAFNDTSIEEFITKGESSFVSNAKVNKKNEDTKYNLQGMKIKSPQNGEVYIQDGMKYIKK